MPKGDGTGPMGMGSMTGRGAGICAGFKTPGYANSRVRRGMWFGQGRGQSQGFRRMFWLAGVLPGCAYLTYWLFNRNRIQK